MIKFLIVSRRKHDLTRKRFFYEWAFIHVSLMLHTLPSMQRFRRYVQHFANPDIPDEFRVLPRSTMNWESIAEHWLERFDPAGGGPEYVEQMQPHKFSDSAMEIAYVQGEVAYRRDDFRSGGVKVVHRLLKRPNQTIEDFRRHWRDTHVPLLIATLKNRGLRKYELDSPYEFDPALFHDVRKGSLFEQANIDPAQGFEELWFDSLDDAMRIGSDPTVRATLSASYGGFVDVGRSHSMIANERVVYDYVTPGEISPRPAVLDSTTLDAVIFKTGRPYHEPRLK